MMKDKALEELFLAKRPQFDDKDEFMSRLTRKLDAVEYLRQYEEATLRHYKYAMVAVFVMGLVAGGALLAFITSVPLDTPLLDLNVSSDILLTTVRYSRTIATIVLSLVLSFGIISIISNILDIVQMRGTLKASNY